MKVIYGAMSLALGASAATLSHHQCCFSISASGGVSGILGQLDDGQNRVGGDYPAASYCIKDGGITDTNGRGCILTPPTTQFQCDVGASPTTGFSIANNGEIQYNGNSQFYACPATDSEYNIYTTPVEGQAKCVQVHLSTGGQCSWSSSYSPSPSVPHPISPPVISHSHPTPSQSGSPSTSVQPCGNCPQTSTTTASVTSYITSSCNQCSSTWYTSTTVSSSSVPMPVSSPCTVSIPTTDSAPPPSYSSPSSSASSQQSVISTTTVPGPSSVSACQKSLTGPYQTPHLIVPISSSSPDTAYGTSYNGQINSTTSSIFNFDVPLSYEGKTCSVIFLFPRKEQLQTSNYDFSGSGEISFSQLNGVASESTTWNNVPSVKSELDTVAVQAGNSYVISSSSCASGSRQSIELKARSGLSLNFFQDWNPSPIGLFMTAC